MARRIVLVLAAVLFAAASALAQSVPQPTEGNPAAVALAAADQQLASGDVAGARSQYLQVIATYPSSASAAQAVQGVSNTYVMQNDYRGMVGYLQNVITTSSDAVVAQRARVVYSQMAQSFDNEERQVDGQYQYVKAQYDSISWWNIFRIFEKLSLRSQLSNIQNQRDQIIELQLLFNPTYEVPIPTITGPSDGNANANANANSTSGGSSNTNATGGSSNANTASSSGGNTGASNANGGTDTSTGANSNTSTSSNSNSSSNGGNSNSSTAGTNSNAASGTTTTSAYMNSKVASAPSAPTTSVPSVSDIVARAQALKLLQGELAAIMALIPADKRGQAEAIIAGGSGLSTAAGPSSALTTSTTATPVPAPSVVPSPAASVAAVPVTSSTTGPAGPTSVAGTQPSTTPSPVPSPAASTVPPPSPPPAATALSLTAAQAQVVTAYRAYIETLRSGDRSSAAATQARQAYVAALEAQAHARAQLLGRAGEPTPPSASPPAPTAPTSSPSAAPPSHLLVQPTGPSQPVSGASPSAGSSPTPAAPSSSPPAPVRVNPAVDAGGRPISNGEIQTDRGSLQPR